MMIIKRRTISYLLTPLCYLLLSACGGGGGDTAVPTAPTTTPTATITISGKVTTEDVTPEANVTVKALYSDADPTNPSTMTALDGTYSLTVESNKAASVQWSKSGFVSFNTEKAASSVNITDADQDMLTSTQVQIVIELALGINTTPLANKAWLVVFVKDAMDNEIPGVSIKSNADVEVYPECNGTNGNSTTTVAPCPSRPVMYIAYFNAAAEVSVTAASDTKIAPVRMGEITVLDFETASAGQVKYDADCASCHAAGTYDTTTSNGASDLIGDSSLLIENISIYSPAKKTAVADLSPQEISDLKAFLDNL